MTFATPGEQHPSLKILELIQGLWIARSIHIATNLHLAELLKDGPRSTQELAKATGTHAPSLYRLMRSLASVGIFTETDPDQFAQTPLSDALRSDRPDSIHYMARLYGQPWQLKIWEKLEYSIRTGEDALTDAYGQDVWEFTNAHPDEGQLFNQAMTSFSAIVNAPIAQSYDFSGFKTLVDVGGGHGSLLSTILQANPHLKGTLFERASVLDRAHESIDRALQERIELVTGDFFTSVPEGLDAYIMKQVIHDWTQEESAVILSNCRKAMRSDSKLLVADRVLLPGGESTAFNKYWDLLMLVVVRGRERTVEEFEQLYSASGFKLTRIIPTGTPISIVEGIPA